MEPEPTDRRNDPPDTFVIVPLTIPVMLVYAVFRYPKVGLPIMGVLLGVLALTVVTSIPLIVGAPVMCGLGLAGLWWLRLRLQRDDQDA
jgi:hypothetical protein